MGNEGLNPYDTEEAWGCASSQVTKSLGLLDVSSNEGI